MSSKPCPNCRFTNPAANSYCGNCGGELRESALIVSRPSHIQLGEKQLTTPQVKALTATVAVGVAALLAEVGFSYLQRRLSRAQRPSFSLRRRKPTAEPGTAIVPAKKQNGRVITVVGERVIEEKRWGRPVRRVVERFAWRGEERNS